MEMEMKPTLQAYHWQVLRAVFAFSIASMGKNIIIPRNSYENISIIAKQ